MYFISMHPIHTHVMMFSSITFFYAKVLYVGSGSSSWNTLLSGSLIPSMEILLHLWNVTLTHLSNQNFILMSSDTILTVLNSPSS